MATFVRTHEKALANAAQYQRRTTRHRPTQSTSAIAAPRSPTTPERPATSTSNPSSYTTAVSFGALALAPNNVKSAKLALTPHHLFYLLSRFEELNIDVGPMKVRLENLHDSTTSANYVSFLSNAQRSNSHGSDAGSIRSVSSVRSAMSGMAALWASFGIGASISAARTERQKAALQTDMTYLYSAFTKIPCLKLAPDWRARLIRGYEEFPFDSAVPLYAFKNLQALEVTNIDFRQFFGWDRLADQLRSLTLKRAGIEDPADILIDIVLDDMDKRRRRTSKSQSSPTGAWGVSANSRRNSTLVHPELHRSATAPIAAKLRLAEAKLAIGSVSPNENAIEDNTIDSSAAFRPDDVQTPPTPIVRPRSISPSRSSSPRHPSHYRSQKMRRSGSGSSQSSMSESWQHHNKGHPGSLLAMGILPTAKWRFLRHLSLADNSITSIPPASLNPLSNTLYSLDLSSNLFTQIPESLASLTALRALNLSHCMIDSLSSLVRNPLPAITALNLRGNRLQSLAGVEKLLPLERLDLRNNLLNDPTELARLTNIPEIREVWLDGNPFTRNYRDYRITIFNIFRKTPGYTADIIIDGTGPSYIEKRQLLDRAPLPELVPVVKGETTEVPAIDVANSFAPYGGVDESAILRKNRPVPTAIASEMQVSTNRHRKSQKRRIVDLSASAARVPPTVVDLRSSRPQLNGPNAPIVTEENYRMTHSLESPLVLGNNAPRIAAEPRSKHVAGYSGVGTRYSTEGIPSKTKLPTEKSFDNPQIWNQDAELYEHEIGGLQKTNDTGYFQALDKKPWGSTVQLGQAELEQVVGLVSTHDTHRLPNAQTVTDIAS